ncbi:MAG: cadmium-translocating P-type ATPase [Halanaerobiales bacterium]|nr:cadmium-translocating P-type ATPase [Halanaerobiales bacterium]
MEEIALTKAGKKETFLLEDLSCSYCASQIEAAVQELPQVEQASLNFAAGKITVVTTQTEQSLLGRVQQLVGAIEPAVKVLPPLAPSKKTTANSEKGNRTELWRLAVGTLFFILGIIFYELPAFSGKYPVYLEWLLFGVSYLIIGGPVVVGAFRNIIRGQVFDEQFLMTIATLGAFIIAEYSEGVGVMLFYMIGEMFQNKAVDRSRRSIKELMNIRPDYANMKKGDLIEIVDPTIVKKGDLIVVKPGEKIPLDGEVVEGKAMLDTSALTGESVPRQVEPGDAVLSGVINQDGLLTIKVVKEYNQSTVARILELVENAAAHKAPTEQFITKFARYYTPLVVYAALAIAIIPPLFVPGAIFVDWLYRALIFLVVSCPCALVISIPLGFFGGIGRASRQGILVKGGNYLEALNQVKTIVFDKTGTLTEGVFKVNQIKGVNGFSADDVLSHAALAEAHSNHPIANSIKETFSGEIEMEKIESYQEIAGQGIKVNVAGQVILAGNQQLLAAEGIKCQPVEAEGSIIYLAIGGTYAGYLTIADQIKPELSRTIGKLKVLGIKKLTMLTGDRQEVARTVAEKIGLDSFYAELLPQQKVSKVEEMLNANEQGLLAFVGDGINDAPVLARSDLGIAMGALGSDAAIEAADLVLMTDEPAKLVTAIETARKTKAIVWQNIVLALGVKGIVILMGAFGIATMWEAVFADVGVALLAIINSMRIIKN